MHEIFDLIGRYGAGLIFLNVLINQSGFPLPVVPTLVVAGALAAQGEFSAAGGFAGAFAATLLANSAWYLAGRLYGRQIILILCRISFSPDSCVRQTETFFDRRGGLTLIAAKFIPGLVTMAPPLAGASGLGWGPFLFYSSVGTALWAGMALGAGMIFQDQIHSLVHLLARLGPVALAVIGAAAALFIAVKWWERQRFHHRLRMARITVHELARLMEADAKPLIFDVRSRLVQDLDRRFIPGALAIEINQAETSVKDLPAEHEIIFYCSCPNEASAAQVARSLIDRGYRRVRPLQGGLEAWIEAGFAVERRMREPPPAPVIAALPDQSGG